MNDDTNLLPCPFCGSDLVSRSIGRNGDGSDYHYVECEKCAATAEPEKWNARAFPAVKPISNQEAYAKERDAENRDALRKLAKAMGNPAVSSNVSLADGLVEYAIRRMSAVDKPVQPSAGAK